MTSNLDQSASPYRGHAEARTPSPAVACRHPLVDKVLHGLRAEQFRVAFQPIVELHSGKLMGFEALLRWQHPQYGLLLPGYFADALEDEEVARNSAEFVIGEACAQLAEWRSGGGAFPRLFINIQPSLLMDSALSVGIAKATNKHSIDPSLITLELVESEDVTKMLSLLEFTRPLKALGVQLALDDFGTGYSSLAALDALDVDTVKLAQRLVSSIPSSGRAGIVTDGVLDMLERLDVKVIVEGVETAEQAAWLSRRRDIYIQGFFIARPQPTLAQAASSIRI
jgi:EAL domain-containing protein (putative c-di-GMP-specific phosphodiesterase class I)